MKLNSFEVNADAIEQGRWITDIPDCGDLRIQTKGINNLAYSTMQQQKIRAVPRGDRRNGVSVEVMTRINTECLIATCIQDWGNLLDNEGQPLPFTKAKATELLFDPRYRPLLDACFFAATAVADQRDDEMEDDVKNFVTA